MCPLGPVAFSVFGIEMRWYGIIIAVAILLGISIANKRAQRVGFEKDLITDMALIVIPAAIIGARLYYVVFEWQHYANDPMQIFNIRAGGLAIHGGLLFGVISGVLYAKWKKLDVWKLADAIAPVLPLGQAIGRWGNYINKEAHGGPTDLPWGIMVDGVKVHPTFLYESMGNILIFLYLLFILEKKKKFDGELICHYGILYSVIRFFIEGLRTDSLMFFGLRQAQLISVAIIVLCIAILAFRKKQTKS